MKPENKIKLQSEAATLFQKLTGRISPTIKVPVLTRLSEILSLLISSIAKYVRPVFERVKSISLFQDKITGSLVGKCEFTKGVNLEAINDAGQALTDVHSRFDMGILKFFGSPSKAIKKASISGSVIAHYCGATTPLQKRFHPNVDQINVSTKSFRRYTQEEKEQFYNYSIRPDIVAKFKQNAHAWLERSRLFDPHQDKLISIIKNRENGPFTINHSFELNSGLEMTMGSMYHELGHRFHAWLGRDEIDKSFIQQITLAHLAGWGFALSAYATKNEREYFAETFCAYMMGSFDPRYYEMINPTILEYLQKYDKKNIEKELAA